MKTILNKWTLILLGIFICFSLMIMTQCTTHKKENSEWRYEIHGYVLHKGQQHEAIWFTDTLEIGDNYVSYQNSDGSQVVIPAPFVLIDHKFDKVDTNVSNPFR